ncbi:MAG: response regulator [Bacteroidia bacterium]|nr:response regulator [Bacteroidia bacterium]
MKKTNTAHLEFAYASLRPVSLSFVIMYLFFAASHFFLLKGYPKPFMITMAIISAVFYAGMYLYLLKKDSHFNQTVFLSFCLLLFPFINTFAQIWLYNDPLQSSVLLILFVGTGLLLTSRTLVFLIIFSATSAWLYFAYKNDFNNYWLHFSYTLIPAIILAVISNFTVKSIFIKIQKASEEAEFKNKELAQAVTIFKNQSDQIKKNNKQLEIAKQEAEKATRAKSDFLAKMSHEIRTPLNSVVGFSDLLISTELSPIQMQYMENVNNSAKSLLVIVNDILDFSKIESGKIELEAEVINLYDLGNQITEVIKYQVLEKNVAVVFSFQDGLPRYILGDLTRLRQILINLMGNAVKFTHKGKIELYIEAIINSENRYRKFRFSIIDTGIGIDLKSQQRIFNAFEQEDSTITRKLGGTGLGLTISNRLLGLMNSKLQLFSSFGKGSTFYFDIDLELLNSSAEEILVPFKNEVIPLIKTIETGNEITASPTILIVDDNSVNIFLIVSMLKNILPNAKILEARNGFAAIKSFSEEQPDLILMDVQMPEMNGYDATSEIRSLETNGRVPIIGLTAGVLFGEKEKCLAAGMDEYITKPILKETIEKVIDKWLVYVNQFDKF